MTSMWSLGGHTPASELQDSLPSPFFFGLSFLALIFIVTSNP